VRLASPQEFEQASIDFSEFLSNLSFKIIPKNNQEAIVFIKSEWPVIDPYLNFILDITWGTGHFLKEFAILIDPLEFKDSPASNLATQSSNSSESSISSGINRSVEKLPVPTGALPVNSVPNSELSAKKVLLSKEGASEAAPPKARVKAQVISQVRTAIATAPVKSQVKVLPVSQVLASKPGQPKANPSWVLEQKLEKKLEKNLEKKSLELLPENADLETDSVGQRLETIENMLHNLAEDNKILREKQEVYKKENHSLQVLLNTKEMRVKELEKAFESKEKANLLLLVILGILSFGALISLIFLIKFKKIKTRLNILK